MQIESNKCINLKTVLEEGNCIHGATCSYFECILLHFLVGIFHSNVVSALHNRIYPQHSLHSTALPNAFRVSNFSPLSLSLSLSLIHSLQAPCYTISLAPSITHWFASPKNPIKVQVHDTTALPSMGENLNSFQSFKKKCNICRLVIFRSLCK